MLTSNQILDVCRRELPLVKWNTPRPLWTGVEDGQRVSDAWIVSCEVGAIHANGSTELFGGAFVLERYANRPMLAAKLAEMNESLRKCLLGKGNPNCVTWEDYWNAYESEKAKDASSAPAVAAQAPRRSAHTADSMDPLTASSPTVPDTPDRS